MIPCIGPLPQCEATLPDGERCPEVASHRVRMFALEEERKLCSECAAVVQGAVARACGVARSARVPGPADPSGEGASVNLPDHCDFCGKTRREVGELVFATQGRVESWTSEGDRARIERVRAGACICDECVFESAAIVARQTARRRVREAAAKVKP